MNGSFEESGNRYEWWAGPASPEAQEDWCVHCRSGEWGVTAYVSVKPSEQEAEQRAKGLTGHVDRLQS